MKQTYYLTALSVLCLVLSSTTQAGESIIFAENGQVGYKDTPKQPWSDFLVHDLDRPRPPKVEVNPAALNYAPAPKNAIVLFDGTNLDSWKPTKWIINDQKNLQCVGGGINTKQEFGDFQLHLEFRSPKDFKGPWGNTGNNGVIIFSNVEIQIFDNYTVDSYADGLCGAIYGQFPPLVNACLPPGTWQTYDIFFRAPKYDENKKMTESARVSILFNGQLVQDNSIIYGGTRHGGLPTPFNGRKTGTIGFSGHGCPVEFRNVWVIPHETPAAPVCEGY